VFWLGVRYTPAFAFPPVSLRSREPVPIPHQSHTRHILSDATITCHFKASDVILVLWHLVPSVSPPSSFIAGGPQHYHHRFHSFFVRYTITAFIPFLSATLSPPLSFLFCPLHYHHRFHSFFVRYTISTAFIPFLSATLSPSTSDRGQRR
jgi:hypothetical protein